MSDQMINNRILSKSEIYNRISFIIISYKNYGEILSEFIVTQASIFVIFPVLFSSPAPIIPYPNSDLSSITSWEFGDVKKIISLRAYFASPSVKFDLSLAPNADFQ